MWSPLPVVHRPPHFVLLDSLFRFVDGQSRSLQLVHQISNHLTSWAILNCHFLAGDSVGDKEVPDINVSGDKVLFVWLTGAT